MLWAIASERNEPTVVGLVRLSRRAILLQAATHLACCFHTSIGYMSFVSNYKSVDLTLLRPTLSATTEVIKGYHSADLKDRSRHRD